MKELIKSFHKIDKRNKTKLTTLIIVGLLCAFLISLMLSCKYYIIESIKDNTRNNTVGISQFVVKNENDANFSALDIDTSKNNNIKQFRIIIIGGSIVELNQKATPISIYGCDIADYPTVFPSSKIKEGTLDNFDKNKIALSYNFAKDNNIACGDNLVFTLNGKDNYFEVACIIDGGAIFAQSNLVMISLNLFNALLGQDKNTVNQVFLYK